MNERLASCVCGTCTQTDPFASDYHCPELPDPFELEDENE